MEDETLEVLLYPHEKLRAVSLPVPAVTPALQRFAAQMLKTMYHYNGIGLSAPQVGQNIRYFCTDTRVPEHNARYDIEDQSPLERKVPQPLHIFNPVILNRSKKQSFREGCLSIPGYLGEITRPAHIEVKGLDLNGNTIQFETDGLLAVCIQHELDHLDGVLFLDHLPQAEAQHIKHQIQTQGYPQQAHEPPETPAKAPAET